MLLKKGDKGKNQSRHSVWSFQQTLFRIRQIWKHCGQVTFGEPFVGIAHRQRLDAGCDHWSAGRTSCCWTWGSKGISGEPDAVNVNCSEGQLQCVSRSVIVFCLPMECQWQVEHDFKIRSIKLRVTWLESWEAKTAFTSWVAFVSTKHFDSARWELVMIQTMHVSRLVCNIPQQVSLILQIVFSYKLMRLRLTTEKLVAQSHIPFKIPQHDEGQGRTDAIIGTNYHSNHWSWLKTDWKRQSPSSSSSSSSSQPCHQSAVH